MAFGLDFPLINGVRHSWSSVGFKAAGITWGGITEINYGAKLEAAAVYGAGPLIVGTTTGKASYSMDFTMLLQEADDMIAALGDGWMTAITSAQVDYSDEGYTGSGTKTITDSINPVRIVEFSQALSNGSADAAVRKFTCIVWGMLLNGKNPMPNQPSLSVGGVAGAATGVIQRIL